MIGNSECLLLGRADSLLRIRSNLHSLSMRIRNAKDFRARGAALNAKLVVCSFHLAEVGAVVRADADRVVDERVRATEAGDIRSRRS